MGANLNKPHLWKADIAASVDLYNDWFLTFAPKTYREERVRATEKVEAMLQRTNRLRNITPAELREHPAILFALRMATAPPLARDRLIGLANLPKSLVKTMEIQERLPPKMRNEVLEIHLGRIVAMILRLADVDIFPWLTTKRDPTHEEVHRAATVVADRLCGAYADPIVRNAQEKRQLKRSATGWKSESTSMFPARFL